ncbi:MAG TPA: hypothetical protein VMU33_20040 [Burkholderiaceae bacterium]|nr:hypothetical protein [Burkholderiaceae bacterium]
MSTQMVALFEKQARLVRELKSLNERIAAASAKAAKQAGAKPAKSGKPAKTAKRKSWFARGEALVLLKKLATKPSTQADLVRAVLAAKGYDKGLASADLKRVQSATFQAIANAIAGKQLAVGKDGRVSAKA